MAYRSRKLNRNMIDFSKGVRLILSGFQICPERGLQSYFNKMLNDIVQDLAKKSIKKARKNSGLLTENEVFEAINELFPTNLKQRLFEKMALNFKNNETLTKKRPMGVNQAELTHSSNTKELPGIVTCGLDEMLESTAMVKPDNQQTLPLKNPEVSIYINNEVKDASPLLFNEGNIGDNSYDSAFSDMRNDQPHPVDFLISSTYPISPANCIIINQCNQETISGCITNEQIHNIPPEVSENNSSQSDNMEISCQIGEAGEAAQLSVPVQNIEDDRKMQFQSPQVQRCILKKWYLAPFFPFS